MLRGESSHGPFRRKALDQHHILCGRGDLSPRLGQDFHRLGALRGAQLKAVPGRGRDQVLDAGIGDDLAAADHHEVVGGILQLAHQVAGDEHGTALRRQRAQEAAHPYDAHGVHAVERFVQHEDGRVAEQCGGDAEALPHAEREAACRPSDGRLQAHLLDHLGYAPTAQALGVGQPQQVVAGSAAGLQRAGVQQRADVGQRVPQAPVRLPADHGGAIVGRVQAENDPHRSGLPGPVRADEAGNLRGWDAECHPVKRDRRPEPLAQAVHFDRRFQAA